MKIVKEEENLILKLIESKKKLEHEKDSFGFVYSTEEGFRNGAFGFEGVIYPKIKEYLDKIKPEIEKIIEDAVKEESDRISVQIKELSEKL